MQNQIKEADINHLPDITHLLNSTLTDGPLYVHIDTDILNPADAPAMNYPAAGGPSAKTLQTVMRQLNRTKKIAAVSVSTWNPVMDQNGQSRKVCMALLDTLINDEATR